MTNCNFPKESVQWIVDIADGLVVFQVIMLMSADPLTLVRVPGVKAGFVKHSLLPSSCLQLLYDDIDEILDFYYGLIYLCLCFLVDHRLSCPRPEKIFLADTREKGIFNKTRFNFVPRGVKCVVIFNSKCWKLVFRAFPFMGMFDWGGGIIPAAQIFQTPTLYTRVSFSLYQSMTIIGPFKINCMVLVKKLIIAKHLQGSRMTPGPCFGQNWPEEPLHQDNWQVARVIGRMPNISGNFPMSYR